MNKRKSILIIDDLQENLRLLVTLLQKEGYRVRPTRDGLRGLATAQAELPDLILLDIKMPGLNGIEVCQQLKADERTRHIPVIFLSALADTKDKIRGFQAGAVDYVTKPIEEDELLARVNTHLALRSLVQNEMELERHRALSQMVAGMAHELNTPLGIANTAADMIAKRLNRPEVNTLFQQSEKLRIERQKIIELTELLTRNITGAYQQLQSFKQIAVNQLTAKRESVNLPDTVSDIVALFQVNVRQSNLRIEIYNVLQTPASSLLYPERNSDSPVIWHGYPGYLSQVVMNLLSNVAHYAYPEGQGGSVEITIAEATVDQQPGFALTIRDRGQGIAPDQLARIFEPFFTTGRLQGGLGLGMTIVHNIVTTALQGHIHVESVLDEGTIIHVTFPKMIAIA